MKKYLKIIGFIFLQIIFFFNSIDQNFGQDASRHSFNINVKDSFEVSHLNTRQLLLNNYFLSSSQKPSNFIFQKVRNQNNNQQILFYITFLLFTMFAVLKSVFNNYSNNLIKVFLNSTLRQGQLTEQLLLSKLPSIFYNLFFVLVFSIYIYAVMKPHFFNAFHSMNFLFYIFTCVLITYFTKFIVLQFSGWLTGFKQEVENYIFIVFLINKILAILLLPILTMIIFSDGHLSEIAIKVSYVIVFVMIFLRYLRAFTSLNRKLNITKFHFFIYVVGIEFIPILLICKSLMNIVDKSL